MPQFNREALEARIAQLETEMVEKVDIWSLGCILAELYTGNILFDFESNQDKLHMEAIFNMLGEKGVVGGQEDLIIEIASELSKQQHKPGILRVT